MRIEYPTIRPGDNIIFKRSEGFGIALVLSWIIKIFYPKWDMWGWHMAVVVAPANEIFVSKFNRLFKASLIVENGGWIVIESTWPVVRLNNLSLMGEYRPYRWFDEPLENPLIDSFIRKYIGWRYDVLLYFWTAAAYLFRHFWNRPIPRLLDNRYTCWELAAEFDEAMGKPVCSKYDCPILPDIQTELEK